MLSTLLIIIFAISTSAVNNLSVSNCPPATSNVPATNKAATASNSPSGPNSKVFQLNATKVELSLQQLNDVGLDLKNVLTATRHLYDEVMIQPVDVITEPEMIAGTVINIPVGTEPIGPPAPPRKARVDMIMSQLKPVIALLKQNADEFMSESQVVNFPEDVQPQIEPLFKKWLAYMDDAYARLLDLEKLTAGPPYDNYAIADTTKIIQNDIKQIDDMRRPIYKLIQQEGKKLMQTN